MGGFRRINNKEKIMCWRRPSDYSKFKVKHQSRRLSVRIVSILNNKILNFMVFDLFIFK